LRSTSIVHDGNGHALAYVYFEGELSRQTAAKLVRDGSLPSVKSCSHGMMPDALLRT
jgi:hypothetical protein